MSRFYFDFRLDAEPSVDRDDVGVEFETLVEAKHSAIKALLEAAQDQIPDLAAGEEFVVRVREADRLLCTLTLILNEKN